MRQLTQDQLGQSNNDRHTNPRRLQFDHDIVPYGIGNGRPEALSVDDFKTDRVRRATRSGGKTDLRSSIISYDR
jgi:hypothetical protein